MRLGRRAPAPVIFGAPGRAALSRNAEGLDKEPFGSHATGEMPDVYFKSSILFTDVKLPASRR
jgi:hypothetical protein